MTTLKRFHIVLPTICLCVLTYASPQKVRFETSVDTRSKNIYLQEKKTCRLGHFGHWRHNANEVDTNCDWSVYHQKEIRQATKYINKHLKANKAKLVLGLDFHSTYEDVFYTNEMREGTSRLDFIDDWFMALEASIDGYEMNEASSNSTKPVSIGWFLYGHNAVGIAYEIRGQTPKEPINEIAETSAKQMMKILLK